MPGKSKIRPFKLNFERSVNENMHDRDNKRPRPSPDEAEDAEVDSKKGHFNPEPEYEYDHEHGDDKKDRPPRFSTLFGNAAAAPPTSPAVRQYHREYYPRQARKSGVFMPMPLFIIFAIILCLETTILFAYTIIGLYNNAPTRVFPWAGPSSVPAQMYACADKQQGGVNFAPNFVMPGAAQPQYVTQLVTISAAAESTNITTTSSVDTTSVATAIADIINGLTPQGTTASPNEAVAVVTETVGPSQSTVHALTVISVDPQGNPIPPTTTTTPSSSSSSSSSSSASTSSTPSAPPTAMTPTTPATLTTRDAPTGPTTNAAQWATISAELAEASKDLTAGLSILTQTTATTSETSITAAAALERKPATTRTSIAATQTPCGTFNWLVGNVCIN